MDNPFEQGAQAGHERANARKEFMKRYKDIMKKIHEDLFNGDKKWAEEASEITKKLNNLKDGCDETGKKDPGLRDWQNRTSGLDDIEREVDDFLRRYEEEKKGGKKESKEAENPEEKPFQGGAEEINKDFEEDYGVKKEEESDAEKIEKDLIEDLGGNKGKEDNSENLEQLKQEMENRRKEYLEFEYKKKNSLKRVWNYFKSVTRNKEEEGKNFERDVEVAKYRAYYDDALLSYKNALLEDAKSRNISDKELLEIAKTFQLEANVGIADGHDQVKIENQEGRFSGFIKEHSKELVERYKKLPLAKKIAIGAAFGVAAVGAGYAGAAAVGVVGSAAAIRRAFLGVVTGTTVSLVFENRGKKKTEKDMQKEMEDLEKKMEGLSIEEKIKLINQTADKDIKDEDNKINKIKNKNLRHLAYGVAAGAAGTLLPKITRMFSEKTGAGEWVKEHLFGKSGIPDHPDMMGKYPESQSTGEGPFSVPEEKPTAGPGIDDVQGTKIEVPNSVVEVKKGDSVWKIVEEQLKNRYSNQFAEMKPDQKTYVIDALKDKVAENPEAFGLKDANMLEIGQKLDLSNLFKDESEVGRIFDKAGNLSKEAYENISKGGNASRGVESSLADAENTGETKKINQEEYDAFKKRIDEIRAKVTDAEKDYSDVDQSSRNKIINDIQEKSDEASRWKEEVPSKWETGIYENNLNRLEGDQRRLWEDLFKEETVAETVKDVRKDISLNSIDNWKSVKDLTFSQAKTTSGISHEVKKRILDFYKSSYDMIGEGSHPKRGETIAKWTERVSRMIVRGK